MESLTLRRSPGFTLIELMLSMATGGALLLVLAELFGSTLTAFHSHDRRLGCTLEARSALQQLSTDLAAYCELPLLDGTGTMMQTPGLVYVAGRSDKESDRVAFLRRMRPPSTLAANNAVADEGNLALVAYAVGYTLDSAGQGCPKLFRKQFSVAETYERVVAAYHTGASLVLASDWQAITVGRDGAEPVAFYVVQFRAQPLMPEKMDQDGDGEPSIVGLRSVLQGEVGSDFRPAALDLLLRVGHRSLATRLETSAQWRGVGVGKGMILGHPATPNDYSDDPEVETRQQRVSLVP
jgi:hypothetical protein